MTTTHNEQQALELCDLALQHMWRGEVDAAIETYDRALSAASGEDVRELITIRKAEALIAADREGPEVTALPSIVMRRRSPRHVYIAGMALMRRFVEADDRRRALFYGEIASKASKEMGDAFARASLLNSMGITLVADSQFKAGALALEEALDLLGQLTEDDDRVPLLRVSILASLGGAKILSDDVEGGVMILEEILPDLTDDYNVAEASLDLCFAYLQLGRYALAESYGRRALALAAIKRQIRNANHLLGEVCVRTERYSEADAFFEVVAGFYPDFKNVKQLLVAVDLCTVVNWKA